MRIHPSLLFAVGLMTACGNVGPNHQADAPPTPPDVAVCTPETDAQLCTKLGTTCGPASGTDKCGMQRTVNCGVCPAVCSNLSFATTALITEVNSVGQQDAIMGVSGNGHTVLSMRRTCFGAFTLLLTDGLGSAPATIDISNNPGLGQMDALRESAIGLTNDGLSIIGATKAGTGLAMATRSQIGTADFAVANGGLQQISVAAPGKITAPVLSRDGLELYYQVVGAGAPIDGVYQSVRASTNVPFPAAIRSPALINNGGFVTSISSDRRALFVQSSFGQQIFTRVDVSQEFSNPNGANPAPVTPGFRMRVLDDCQTLVGTCNGGCNNEETCRVTH
jgi:hypothetical protein